MPNYRDSNDFTQKCGKEDISLVHVVFLADLNYVRPDSSFEFQEEKKYVSVSAWQIFNLSMKLRR